MDKSEYDEKEGVEETKASGVPETEEVEQFPRPPKLRRQRAYDRKGQQSSDSSDESLDDVKKEPSKDPVATVPESGDDAYTDDEDLSEAGSEEEGSSYDSYSETEEEDEKEEVVAKRPLKKKKTDQEIDDIVREYLNNRYSLSKKTHVVLGDTFFL